MKKETGICRYCGCSKRLIQSHIVSHSFIREMKKNDTKLFIASEEGQRQTQSGVFDTGILCQECDNIFSVYEKEALKLFKLDLNLYKESELDGREEELYYKIPNSLINTKKVELFFLSLLWKCSATNSSVFSNIDLGKYEEIFKQHLISKTLPECFSVVLSYYADAKEYSFAQTLHHPGLHKINGVNFYEFYFKGFDSRVKVDNRRHSLDKFRLQEDKDMVIINREEFKKGPQYRGMINLFKAYK